MAIDDVFFYSTFLVKLDKIPPISSSHFCFHSKVIKLRKEGEVGDLGKIL